MFQAWFPVTGVADSHPTPTPRWCYCHWSTFCADQADPLCLWSVTHRQTRGRTSSITATQTPDTQPPHLLRYVINGCNSLPASHEWLSLRCYITSNSWISTWLGNNWFFFPSACFPTSGYSFSKSETITNMNNHAALHAMTTGRQVRYHNSKGILQDEVLLPLQLALLGIHLFYQRSTFRRNGQFVRLGNNADHHLHS